MHLMPEITSHYNLQGRKIGPAKLSTKMLRLLVVVMLEAAELISMTS